MRLYDRLMKYGVNFGKSWGERSLGFAALIERHIDGAVAVIADDVAKQWVQAEPISRTSGSRIVASPFPVTVIEARIPPMPKSVISGRLDFAVLEGHEVLILVVQEDVEDNNVDDVNLEWENETGYTLTSAPRWRQTSLVFLHGQSWGANAPLMGLISATVMMIDGSGHLMRSGDGVPMNYGLTPNDLDFKPTAEGIGQFFAHVFHLMNCKNIVLSDVYQSRQEIRRRKRSGEAVVKFKTLAISPTMTPPAENGGERVKIGDMPLHLVRGHFATYSEDKPLFGKYHGTFWKPAHVRGNADNGTVYKDYQVKAPTRPE